MALKGCYACIKYTVLIFNLLFWLAGLTILALSLWVYFDTSSYMQHVSPPEHYNTGLYLLIAVGAIMTVVGFLGCCGALRESQCMLFSYFLMVLLILLAQIIAVVWCVKQKDDLKDLIRDSMKKTVQKEYGKPGQELRTVAFDTLQTEGCANKLEEYLRTHFWTAAAIVIAVMAVEFLGLFFSIVLCCAIRRTDHFKA